MRSGELFTEQSVQTRQQFVSEVFHAISQPLTALRCSLELALLQQLDVRQCRAALAEALAHAEQVTACAQFLRELADGDDTGHPCHTKLSTAVAAAMEEFRPAFESSGQVVRARCDGDVQVIADPDKLQRAFFLLMDYASAEQRDVEVYVQSPRDLRVEFGIPHGRAVGDRNMRARQSLQIAERVLKTTGGEVTITTDGDARSLRVKWPGAIT
jgi:signal transduction histidine kinase